MAGTELGWTEQTLGATLTTMRIGGEVRYLSRPQDAEGLQRDLQRAREMGLSVRVLGGGSNVILPDTGFAGLLIIPAFQQCEIFTPERPYTEEPQKVSERYRQDDASRLHLADPVPATGVPRYVRVGVGVPWGKVVSWSLAQGLLGLHWYARIPCNVGGAVVNNIHGEKHLLSEVIQEVRVQTTAGERVYLPSELAFGYDKSRFLMHRDEVVTEVTFRLWEGEPVQSKQAQEQYLQWTRAKVAAQPPGASCGSTFQNFSEEAVGAGKPVAAAWYIERAGCMGWREGEMEISPQHANFLMNTGAGTQQDAVRLIERVRHAVFEKYGLTLEPELECMQPDGASHQWERYG
jgi:UDP-N-acetylmuramate dehydrogenase